MTGEDFSLDHKFRTFRYCLACAGEPVNVMTMISSPLSLLSKLCLLVLAEKMKLEDAERSLAILTRLATNAECINPIMEGITSFILGLLSLADPNHDAFLDKAITDLFNQIIKVGGGAWETAVFHMSAQNDDDLLMVSVPLSFSLSLPPSFQRVFKGECLEK